MKKPDDDYLILDPSVLAARARLARLAKVVTDTQFILPSYIYDLLYTENVNELRSFLEKWERFRYPQRDVNDFEQWIDELVRGQFPMFRKESRILSEAEVERKLPTLDLPTEVMESLETRLLSIRSANIVVGDILGFSLRSGAPAIAFSYGFHRALEALEVPEVEIKIACVKLFKELRDRKKKYLQKLRAESLPVGGRTLSGSVVLYTAVIMAESGAAVSLIGPLIRSHVPYAGMAEIAEILSVAGTKVVVGVLEKDGRTWC